MTTLGVRLADKGFGRPSGLLGRLGGRLMASGNAATEEHLVHLAELREQDTVWWSGRVPASACRRPRNARHR